MRNKRAAQLFLRRMMVSPLGIPLVFTVLVCTQLTTNRLFLSMLMYVPCVCLYTRCFFIVCFFISFLRSSGPLCSKISIFIYLASTHYNTTKPASGQLLPWGASIMDMNLSRATLDIAQPLIPHPQRNWPPLPHHSTVSDTIETCHPAQFSPNSQCSSYLDVINNTKRVVHTRSVENQQECRP